MMEARVQNMQAEDVFPKFVGRRRRLAQDDELFVEGNFERELFAKQMTVQVKPGWCT